MEDKFKEDLKEIKDIMNRSTRFTSLSGLSGVSAGVAALAGAFLAWYCIFKGQPYLVYHTVELPAQSLLYILLIAVGTLLLAAATAIYFTGKNSPQSLWNHQTKRFLVNLCIPMVTGGLVCLLLLLKGLPGLVPPLTLLFYGLALVNASRDTLTEIRSLGFIQIVLGLVALLFVEYGLLLWALGFGMVHIVFGILIQWKHKP